MKTIEARVYRNGLIVYVTQVPRDRIPISICLIDELSESENARPLTYDGAISMEAVPKLETMMASAIGIEVDVTGTWVRYFCSKP